MGFMGFLMGGTIWGYTYTSKTGSGATPPTVNDDAGDGYSIGSTYTDTNASVSYVCTDATIGAAVWKVAGAPKTNSSGSAPTVNDDIGDGYSVGSTWLKTGPPDVLYRCTSAASGNATWVALTDEAVTLANVLPGDFFSLTKYKDPNSLETQPISVHASNGTISVDYTGNAGVAYDGPSEGVTYRLGFPSGWRGDGTQALVAVFDQFTNPSVSNKPMVCLALCDYDGDPTNGSSQVVGRGIGWVSATNYGMANTTARASALMNATAAFGTYPDGRVVTVFLPAGNFGTEDTNGVRSSALSNVGFFQSTPGTSDFYSEVGIGGGSVSLNEGVWPILTMGFDVIGNERATFSFRLRWAVVELTDASAWAA